MLHIETYTSPIDTLVSGTWGGADGLSSGATGVGAFRIAVGAPCVDARIADKPFDQLSADHLTDERDVALASARQEGRDDATAHAVRALNEAAERLDKARVEAEASLAANAISLAVEIAREIVKVQISSGDFALEEIVRSTLAASEIKRGECAVHLHPTDAETLQNAEFRSATSIVADSEIPRGCVHVETPRGLLVRDPNAALEEIREQLLEDFV